MAIEHNLVNSIAIKPVIHPAAAVTDNTAQVGTIVDMAGFNSAMYHIHTGTLSDADATFTVLIEGGDAANLSDAATIGSTDRIGDNPNFTFADDTKSIRVGFRTKYRYSRLTVTPANNTGNLFLAAECILGHPNVLPNTAYKA